MKLVPTPKPVRIRIRSGESEHGSVDSLCGRFVFDDILPLVSDGRFSRWLRQQSLSSEAERIDHAREGGDAESLKYEVYSVVFKEPDIKDELSLLSSLFAKPSRLYVLRKELNSLPSDQLEQLSALEGIGFKGELFREQGLRTEDLDKRCEYFKLASEAGVEEAGVLYANALSSKTEFKAEQKGHAKRNNTTKKQPDTDLMETIRSLISDYRARAFLESGSSLKYQGAFFKYYEFFDFVFRLRESNDILFFFSNDARGRSLYWEPEKALITAQQLLEYAVYKYRSNSYTLRAVPKISLPGAVFDAFCGIYHNSRHYFVKALDCLCLNFEEFLRIQYAEQ